MNDQAKTNHALNEAQLRESEQKYRILFDNANDAIFLMNDDIFIDTHPDGTPITHPSRFCRF